jgi:hypothetical protein
MVNDYEAGNNSSRDPLEMRAAIEAIRRLRQVLNGQRCIICTCLISPTNPATLSVYDLAVCRNPECAAVILNVPLGELMDADDKEASHEPRPVLEFHAARINGRGKFHAWRPSWVCGLCGRRARPHETWVPAVGEGISCKPCLNHLRERARRQVRGWQNGL